MSLGRCSQAGRQAGKGYTGRNYPGAFLYPGSAPQPGRPGNSDFSVNL